jgi:hypothetical protein
MDSIVPALANDRFCETGRRDDAPSLGGGAGFSDLVRLRGGWRLALAGQTSSGEMRF